MTNSNNIADIPTFAEQVRDVLAVGGDPGFLEKPSKAAVWDGEVDDTAHFGGWGETANDVDEHPTFAELKREIEAVGGDVSFLEQDTATWDGEPDDWAHFGDWKN